MNINHLLYYSKYYDSLFNSLYRYTKYILKQKLEPLLNINTLNSSSILFVHRDEREDPELLRILSCTTTIRYVVIGFNDKELLNLIDLSNFKANLTRAINENEVNRSELFTEIELKEKLKKFFHSHGDDSLYEYLNWTYYFLLNGPEQFLNNEITYEEYTNAFLHPGLKRWAHFKSRFLKYKDLIKLSNFKTVLNELENAINEADNYIKELSGMDKMEILLKNIDFHNQNIEKVKRIDDILSAFYRKLLFGHSSVSNTNS